MKIIQLFDTGPYRAFDVHRQLATGAYPIGSRPTIAVGAWDEAKRDL